MAVALPTGAGKTVIAGMCLEGAARPGALTHTTTLLDQITARLGPSGVVVQTIQGALARGAQLDWDRCFVDESHHIVSPEWIQALALLPPDCLIVGPTATPARGDGRPLCNAFDALVSTARYSDLLAGGWLTPCTVVPANVCGTDPVAAYLTHGNGRPGILFAPTIGACRGAVARLRSAGVRAACIDTNTPDKRRRALVAAYDAGDLDVLASPWALAEGFDSPRAEVCILARHCGALGTYLQCVGRVLRTHPGKTGALLLDCAGASERHGHPTQDREYSLESGIQSPAPPASRPAPRRSGVHRRTEPTPTAQVAGRAVGGLLRGLWRALWG